MFEERDEQGPGYDVVVAGIMVEGGMCEGEKGLEDVWLLLNVGGVDEIEQWPHKMMLIFWLPSQNGSLYILSSLRIRQPTAHHQLTQQQTYHITHQNHLPFTQHQRKCFYQFLFNFLNDGLEMDLKRLVLDKIGFGVGDAL